VSNLGVGERAAHADVFPANQPGLLRLRYHLADQARRPRPASTPPIFGERAVVETEKQVVTHCSGTAFRSEPSQIAEI
jgi:hypothetical protein